MVERKPQYIIELEKLYDEYPGEALAKVLGVSVRQIQKYLQTANAPTPKKETIAKIRESFAKHEKGQPIFDAKNEAENGLKDDLIKLLTGLNPSFKARLTFRIYSFSLSHGNAAK